MAGVEKVAGKTDEGKRQLLRAIPKVDEVLDWLSGSTGAPARLLKSTVRLVLEEKRQDILAGAIVTADDLSRQALLPVLRARLDFRMAPNLKTVINATGVVIHTNLGRSILPAISMEFLLRAACRYSNLEFNLASGRRGSRYALVEELLCELTGAEAGLVVNNNAAAVLLVLDTLAKGREVIVSRGQLVEIGGSFRIPEVMVKSGAKLVEVGATNRTHPRDYEAAVGPETALLLKVHTSNFRLIGFTAEVTLEELVLLGKRHGLPVMEDLGSGSLVDISRFGLPKEPTVGEVIRAGVDVVTFSGDKLLGGPQAGVILGRKEYIDAIKKNQLTRALRIDKLTLAALESVLRLYMDEEEAIATIPTLAMLAMSAPAIERRAKRLLRRLRKSLGSSCRVTLVATRSRVGGGAVPEQGLDSWAVGLSPVDRTINELEKGLRSVSPPVVGRIENDLLLLDMRTVAEDEIPILAAALEQLFGEGRS